MASGNDFSVLIIVGRTEHGSGTDFDHVVILAINGDINTSVFLVGAQLDPVFVVLDILVAVLGSLVVLIAAANILVLSNSSGLQSIALSGVILAGIGLDADQINDLAVLLIGDNEVVSAFIDVGIGGLAEPLAIGLALIVRQSVVLLLDELQVVILLVLTLHSDFQIVASCESDGAQAQSHNQAQNQSNNLLHVWFLHKNYLQKRISRFYGYQYTILFPAVKGFQVIVSKL